MIRAFRAISSDVVVARNVGRVFGLISPPAWVFPCTPRSGKRGYQPILRAPLPRTIAGIWWTYRAAGLLLPFLLRLVERGLERTRTRTPRR